jgi:gas vesicle protein
MDYQTSEHHRSGGTFFTFAAGAIAGAAVALIFAPATGRDARAVISDRSRRAVAKGRDVLNEQASRVKSAIDRGRDQVEAFGERFERDMGPMARESASRPSGFSE